MSSDLEAGVGLESQGGVIRADLLRRGEFEVGTIQGVSRKLQVHRRLVREALLSAMTSTTEEDGAAPCEDGSGSGVHRRDTGNGSQGSAQAASYSQADLERIRQEQTRSTLAERTVRQTSKRPECGQAAVAMEKDGWPTLSPLKSMRSMAIFQRRADNHRSCGILEASSET